MMNLRIHPALRAVGIGIGGLALLVIGSLAAVKGLTALVRAGEPASPVPAAAAPAQSEYAANQDAKKRLPAIIKASRGDWNRVAPEDQRLLDSLTGGHGRALLESAAKQQVAKPQAAKRRPQTN